MQIREPLVNGDSNDVLRLLMKYPEVTDVTPITDLADMLRRGVLNKGAHLGPPKTPPISDRRLKIRQVQGSASPPAWLLTNPILPVLNKEALNNMGRK